MKNSSVTSFFLIVLIAVFIIGCSQDDGDTETPSFTMPSVVSVSPADNDVDVDPGTDVVITLDGAITESLIPSGSVTVSTEAGPVSGSLSLDSTGKIITFTPSSELSLYTSYSISINITHTDSRATQSLEKNYSFRIRDGQWSSLMTVSDIYYGSYNPQVAFYTPDRAVAVFDVIVNDARYWAYSSFWNGSAWSNPGARSSTYAMEGNFTYPVAASNGNGFGISAWAEYDEIADEKLFSSILDDGNWGTASGLTSHEHTDTLISAAAAKGSLESAALVWGVFDDETNYIWTDIYSNGEWGGASQLCSHNGITDPHCAMDGNGNAFAVWIYDQDAYMSRYNASTKAWSDVNQLSSLNTYNTSVACDADGNAILMWYVGSELIKAGFYDASADTLSSAKTLWDPIEWCKNPEAAFDGNGNIMSIWFADGNMYAGKIEAGGWDVWSSSYASTLETIGDATDNFSPEVALDQTGNGFIVYVNYAETSVKVKRYKYNAAWDSWIADETSSTFTTFAGADYIDSNPTLAVSSNGKAVLSFQSSEKIYAAIFE